MKLYELMATMKADTVVKVVDTHLSAIFHGEACIMGTEVPERYMHGEVILIFPEYYKGWGKTGISINVMP